MQPQTQPCPLCHSQATFELVNNGKVKIFTCQNHKPFAVDSGKSENILKDQSEVKRKSLIDDMHFCQDKTITYIKFIDNESISECVSIHEWS
ncbi:hypothetical protein JCM14076_23760 [Methylosoma difficile]